MYYFIVYTLKPMDIENDSDVRPRSSRPNTQTIPELEVYLSLLVLLLLIDHNKLEQVCMCVCLSVCVCVCLYVCLSVSVCVVSVFMFTRLSVRPEL